MLTARLIDSKKKPGFWLVEFNANVEPFSPIPDGVEVAGDDAIYVPKVQDMEISLLCLPTTTTQILKINDGVATIK